MDESFDLFKFAQLVGEDPEKIPISAQDLLKSYQLSYQTLNRSARESCFLETLLKLDEPLTVSGEHRLGDWEQGWHENLERFLASGGDPESLIPRYHHQQQIDRCQGEYIRSEIPYFQVKFYDLFRHYIFDAFLTESSSVYEFGCGTGYNLAILAQMFPDKQLMGFDWAEASVQLVNEIAKAQKYQLSGQRFDMFSPPPTLSFDPGTAVITFNAMEQLGKNFKPFVDFLCQQDLEICVHSEPLLELYDETQFFDYLGARYHRARGYLEGFVPYMRDLERSGQIDILKLQRIPFGNQFHEGYSLLVWKPRRK